MEADSLDKYFFIHKKTQTSFKAAICLHCSDVTARHMGSIRPFHSLLCYCIAGLFIRHTATYFKRATPRLLKTYRNYTNDVECSSKTLMDMYWEELCSPSQIYPLPSSSPYSHDHCFQSSWASAQWLCGIEGVFVREKMMTLSCYLSVLQ